MGKNTKSGFTLVELLVAMTIVMILTVVGMVNYGSAQKSARDAKRKSDLEKMRIAMEMFKQDYNGCYPEFTDDLVTYGYLDSIPTDSKSNQVYCFNLAYTGSPCVYTAGGLSVNGNTRYLLRAKMEADKNGNCSSLIPCVAHGITMTGVNYEVTNP